VGPRNGVGRIRGRPNLKNGGKKSEDKAARGKRKSEEPVACEMPQGLRG